MPRLRGTQLKVTGPGAQNGGLPGRVQFLY